MWLTLDPRRHVAYLRFHEKAEQVQTLRLSDELNMDIAPDGSVYGMAVDAMCRWEIEPGALLRIAGELRIPSNISRDQDLKVTYKRGFDLYPGKHRQSGEISA